MDQRDKFIVFTSNCFGEDRSAALIASVLKRKLNEINPDMSVLGASLISDGNDYSLRGIGLLYSAEVPPSGGFPTRSLKGFLADLFSGSFFTLFRFIKILKENIARIPIAVVVGDVPLLILTRLGLGKKPIIFLAPAKSDYMEPHYQIEEWIIRKYSDIILTHDEFTAGNLRKRNVNALFLGNPMMDELECSTDTIMVGKDQKMAGILPGSREEAYENFLMILQVVEKIRITNVVYTAALPSTLKSERLLQLVKNEGWSYREIKPFPIIEKNGLSVFLTRGVFTEVLKKSDCIIGLAGTANEQAAGLGIPIVSFIGKGPQTTARRIQDQSSLLGGALKFVKGGTQKAANEVDLLLSEPAECTKRAQIGKEIMGGPGGAENIAAFIVEKYLGLLLQSDGSAESNGK